MTDLVSWLLIEKEELFGERLIKIARLVKSA